MRVNKAGVDLIKEFEGFSAKLYFCSGSVETIGWGHAITAEDRVNGNYERWKANGITKREATQVLKQDLRVAENAVASMTKVSLTANQFSALASFTFNLGSGNFQSSTLRAKLNRGDYQGCADEFWKWRRAGGVILQGLVRRREAEKQLFLKEEEAEPDPVIDDTIIEAAPPQGFMARVMQFLGFD